MVHQEISIHKKWLYTIVLASSIGTLCYLFVVLQFDYVSKPVFFWTLIFSLIIASFWSSAMEAAFSTLADGENDFAIGIQTEIYKHFEEFNVFSDTDGEGVDGSHQKKLRQYLRKKRRLIAAHRLASGVERPAIVGAFATLSVILNLSLGILLPYSLTSGLQEPPVLSIKDWIPNWAQLSLMQLDLISEFPESIELSSRTAFIFTACTIPVLVFGKILPKAIALHKPAFWIKSFIIPAKTINLLLGWISIGSTWMIIK